MAISRHAVVFAGASALFLSSAGCNRVTSTCSRDEDFVELEVGTVEGNTYRSADFGGPYAEFPANRTISFKHGLHRTPYSVQFWVAFDRGGVLAPSAGNMTELRAIDGDNEPALDDKRIAVRNDTCSDLWLWVVATAPVE